MEKTFLMKKLILAFVLSAFFITAGFAFPGEPEEFEKSLYAEDVQTGKALPFPLILDQNSDIIMIGDSHFVQMYTDTADICCSWIAGIGRGFSFLDETAFLLLQEQELKGKTILVQMGANDLRAPGADAAETAERYLAFYREKALQWVQRGARVHVLGVYPVREDGKELNAAIDRFNSLLEKGMPVELQFDKLSADRIGKLEYRDSLHFTRPVSVRVYFDLMNMIWKEKYGEGLPRAVIGE